MKQNILKWLKKAFTASTLKKRIVILLTAEILVCFTMMSFISYNAIYTMQQNRVKNVISYNLSQLSTKLMQSYSDMLQISQQMTPQGNIGAMVNDYFSTTEPYSRSVLSRNISSNMSLVSFSNTSLELLMYYHPDKKEILFHELPLRGNFSPESLPCIARTPEVNFQSPHLSQSMASGDQVLSITRNVIFLNGEQWQIYVETKADIVADVNTLSKSGNMTYTLLLLDKNKNVTYSSSPTAFPAGKKLEFHGKSGMLAQYIWDQQHSVYDFDVVLLVPTKSYNSELDAWKNYMIVAFGVSLIVMMGITLMLWKLIYKPLGVLQSEMRAFGKGDSESIQYRTGLNEFDRLFTQFNDMKQKIQQLIIDVEQKEKLRHQLEIEKLSYQINPHFVMNSLNSIHWLAVMHKQPDIDKAISTLILLLHYNLGKSTGKATLRTEIEVLQAYLELQHMRYDFHALLNVTEGEYVDQPIAKFILQPIVENALCHGLDEYGTIKIDIMPDEDAGIITIVVADNGKGMTEETLEMLQQPKAVDKLQMSKGIGLRYVHSMLESYYGDNAKMVIISSPGQGTTVKINLPLDRGEQFDSGFGR